MDPLQRQSAALKEAYTKGDITESQYRSYMSSIESEQLIPNLDTTLRQASIKSGSFAQQQAREAAQPYVQEISSIQKQISNTESDIARVSSKIETDPNRIRQKQQLLASYNERLDEYRKKLERAKQQATGAGQDVAIEAGMALGVSNFGMKQARKEFMAKRAEPVKSKFARNPADVAAGIDASMLGMSTSAQRTATTSELAAYKQSGVPRLSMPNILGSRAQATQKERISKVSARIESVGAGTTLGEIYPLSKKLSTTYGITQQSALQSLVSVSVGKAGEAELNRMIGQPYVPRTREQQHRAGKYFAQTYGASQKYGIDTIRDINRYNLVMPEIEAASNEYFISNAPTEVLRTKASLPYSPKISAQINAELQRRGTLTAGVSNQDLIKMGVIAGKVKQTFGTPVDYLSSYGKGYNIVEARAAKPLQIYVKPSIVKAETYTAARRKEFGSQIAFNKDIFKNVGGYVGTSTAGMVLEMGEAFTNKPITESALWVGTGGLFKVGSLGVRAILPKLSERASSRLFGAGLLTTFSTYGAATAPPGEKVSTFVGTMGTGALILGSAKVATKGLNVVAPRRYMFVGQELQTGVRKVRGAGAKKYIVETEAGPIEVTSTERVTAKSISSGKMKLVSYRELNLPKLKLSISKTGEYFNLIPGKIESIKIRKLPQSEIKRGAKATYMPRKHLWKSRDYFKMDQSLQGAEREQVVTHELTHLFDDRGIKKIPLEVARTLSGKVLKGKFLTKRMEAVARNPKSTGSDLINTKIKQYETELFNLKNSADSKLGLKNKAEGLRIKQIEGILGRYKKGVFIKYKPESYRSELKAFETEVGIREPQFKILGFEGKRVNVFKPGKVKVPKLKVKVTAGKKPVQFSRKEFDIETKVQYTGDKDFVSGIEINVGDQYQYIGRSKGRVAGEVGVESFELIGGRTGQRPSKLIRGIRTFEISGSEQDVKLFYIIERSVLKVKKGGKEFYREPVLERVTEEQLNLIPKDELANIRIVGQGLGTTTGFNIRSVTKETLNKDIGTRLFESVRVPKVTKKTRVVKTEQLASYEYQQPMPQNALVDLRTTTLSEPGVLDLTPTGTVTRQTTKTRLYSETQRIQLRKKPIVKDLPTKLTDVLKMKETAKKGKMLTGYEYGLYDIKLETPMLKTVKRQELVTIEEPRAKGGQYQKVIRVTATQALPMSEITKFKKVGYSYDETVPRQKQSQALARKQFNQVLYSFINKPTKAPPLLQSKKAQLSLTPLTEPPTAAPNLPPPKIPTTVGIQSGLAAKDFASVIGREIIAGEARPVRYRYSTSVSSTNALRNIVRPSLRVGTKPEIRLGVKPDIRTSVKPDIKVSLKPEVKPVLRTNLRTNLRVSLRPELRTELRMNIRPGFTITAPPPPPTTIIPILPSFTLRDKSTLGKALKFKRKTKYLPSLVALATNTRGRESKVLTGLEVRSITG